MTAIAIDAYIFDCGGVITFAQDASLVARMAAILGTDPDSFRRAYVKERLNYDRGTLMAAEYWDRVGSLVGSTVPPKILPRLSQLDMESWFNINPFVVDLLATLRPQAQRMLVLSNMTLEGKHHAFGPARYCGAVDWTALFDSFLLSSDLRLVKPEPAIFAACVEAAGTEPGRCLLVDDTLINVEAARAAGMHSIHFTSVAGLAESLKWDFHPNSA